MRGKILTIALFVAVLMTLTACPVSAFDSWVVMPSPILEWSYDRDTTLTAELWVHTYETASGGSLGIAVNRLLVRIDSAVLGPEVQLDFEQTVVVNDSIFPGPPEDTLTYALIGGVAVGKAMVPNDQDALFATVYMTLKSDSLGSIEASDVELFLDSSFIPPSGEYILTTSGGTSSQPTSFGNDTTTLSFSSVSDINPGVIPARFELGQNYPNPFNPNTNIEFAVPARSHVKLDVYNVMGQKVRTLVNEELDAGWKLITWDGKSDSGNEVGSGVYLYRVEAGDFIESKKMMLVK